jgi:hypothetical protein
MPTMFQPQATGSSLTRQRVVGAALEGTDYILAAALVAIGEDGRRPIAQGF